MLCSTSTMVTPLAFTERMTCGDAVLLGQRHAGDAARRAAAGAARTRARVRSRAAWRQRSRGRRRDSDARSARPEQRELVVRECFGSGAPRRGPGRTGPTTSRHPDAGARRASRSRARSSRGNNCRFWKVRERPSAARWCGRRRVMSCPSSRTRPRFGSVMPEMALNSVVLPAPFGPMMPLMLPSDDAERQVVDRAQAAEGHRDAGELERRPCQRSTVAAARSGARKPQALRRCRRCRTAGTAARRSCRAPNTSSSAS